MALLEKRSSDHLHHYLTWLRNQTNPADIQEAFAMLSMHLSREVNNLYVDLGYKGDVPLTIEYRFLPNWDLGITGRIPTLNPLALAEEQGDFIPERQRRMLS